MRGNIKYMIDEQRIMNKIWVYTIEIDKNTRKGIVIADSEYDAIEKVVDAYKRYGFEVYPADVQAVKSIYTDGWNGNCTGLLEIVKK